MNSDPDSDLYPRILECASDGVILTDEKGHIIFWNDSQSMISGIGRDQTLGALFWDVPINIVSKDFDSDVIFSMIKLGVQQILKIGSSPAIEEFKELDIVDPAGKKRTIETKVFGVKTDKGYRACAIVREMTERKRAMEEIRTREEELRIIHQASMAVLEHTSFEIAAGKIFNLSKEITGARAGYIALLSADGSNNDVLFLDDGGLPCTVDPNLPMPIRGLRAEAYRTGKAVMDNDFMKSTWVRFMPPGHVVLKNVLFAPLPIEGTVLGIMGLANKDGDFTDRDLQMSERLGYIAAMSLKNSRAKELLEKALEDKEFLMRELNHRVKNNLAIISSLISFKATGMAEDSILQDLRNQIESIRFVYEKLHNGKEVSQIRFDIYCRDFLEALFESSSSLPVALDLCIEEILLDSRKAVYLGLLVNELATNTIKYAFSSGADARFTVKMERPGNGWYSLKVANNGRPIPEEVDFENPSTLGLRLVAAMVEQLKGMVTLTKSPHPVFSLRFPEG